MARPVKYVDEYEEEIRTLLATGKTTREVAHILTQRGKKTSKSATARILKRMNEERETQRELTNA